MLGLVLLHSSVAFASADGAQNDSTSAPATAGAVEADPVFWLQKMSAGLRKEDYAGTFTYLRGSTFDTVRIVHIYDEGKQIERLFNLNGDEREMFRDGEDIVCYHPETDGESMEDIASHSVNIGPFSSAFSDRVLATQKFYRFSFHGEDRIAGREAVKVSVSPRNNDRYGYRLWLDQSSGILLQSHLVDRGRIREIFQFTDLEIGDNVNHGALASAIEGPTVSHELAFEQTELTGKPVWRVNWLPDGFRPVRMVGNRLHFSDGVANFSVFVDQSNGAELPEMATTVGGTVVITKRLKKGGSQITVVGEVPVQTARKVAESVEPVIY